MTTNMLWSCTRIVLHRLQVDHSPSVILDSDAIQAQWVDGRSELAPLFYIWRAACSRIALGLREDHGL